MKKLQLLFIAAIFVGCAKESDLVLNDTKSANQIQFNTTNSFKVGEVDGNGNLTITYDIADLTDLCACGVQEEVATGISLTNIPTVGYFLEGLGTTGTSNTTFAVELTLLGNDLMWDDGAHIAMCQNSLGSPCDLTINDIEDFTCSGSSCSSNETGGSGNGGYPSCEDTDWPWAVKDKDAD